MRIFTAIVPPEPILRKVVSFQRSLGTAPTIKHVPPERLHLTLRFFGELDDERLERVQDATREIAGSFAPLRLSLAGTGTFPQHGRPRVYWIGVHDRSGDLARMADTLDRAYRSAGLGRADKPFAPHLTLARAGFVRGAAPRLPERLFRFARLTFETPEFTVPSVHVVGSELSPPGPRSRGRSGPAYTPLAEFPMSGRG